MGSIEQGGTDWMLDESLLSRLDRSLPDRSRDAMIELLVVHKFPLALGERPLSSLSPGERVRAAVICLLGS
jgi:ATPase subunit of ABC transporter with duplicated ATPase domains